MISLLCIKLWLAPMSVTEDHFGAKATMQIGSDFWLKVRVVDNTDDVASFNTTKIESPSIRVWGEVDF